MTNMYFITNNEIIHKQLLSSGLRVYDNPRKTLHDFLERNKTFCRPLLDGDMLSYLLGYKISGLMNFYISV
jgi:hypothetical protein